MKTKRGRPRKPRGELAREQRPYRLATSVSAEVYAHAQQATKTAGMPSVSWWLARLVESDMSTRA